MPREIPSRRHFLSPPGPLAIEQGSVKATLGRRVDGLTVVGSNTDPRASLGREQPVPVVYAYAPSTDERDTSVVPDNVNAGTLAVEHLVATGRRRIGHISGDVSYALGRAHV